MRAEMAAAEKQRKQFKSSRQTSFSLPRLFSRKSLSVAAADEPQSAAVVTVVSDDQKPHREITPPRVSVSVRTNRL